MPAHRIIAVPIGILLTLLAGLEAGLASNDLASGHDPSTGSAQVFTNPQLAKVVVPGTQMGASNTGEEPFTSVGLHFADGALAQIWQDVKVRVLADMARLALCAVQEASCSPGARALRAIVGDVRNRDGLARIGLINRAINLAVKPTEDPFVWQSPLETLARGAGDCKDYAVAKYLALIEAGFPERDVKLVIVRDTAAREDHAIVAVRINAAWFLLDNRWLALIRDVELPRAEPLYILDEHGVRRFGRQQARSTPIVRFERAAD